MTHNTPYVEHCGIPQEPVTVEINGMTFTCNGYGTTRAQGQRVVRVAPSDNTINGKRIDYISLDRHPEIEPLLQAAQDEYETQFTARYPGIYELVNAINTECNYHDSFARMMGDEHNDGVNPPSAPRLNVADARKRYPVAAAYLTIVSYSQSDPSCQTGYNRRCAGKWAIEQLVGGADVIKTRDEMVARYEAQPVVDRS